MTDADQTGNDISIVQRDGRLKITADVDPEGVATLNEMLAEYLRRASAKPKRRHRRAEAAGAQPR